MVQPLVQQFWRIFLISRDAPPPASAVQQILLNGGDSYYLDAGSYTVRVLTGSVWIPGVGIFAAGQSVRLKPDRQGAEIRTYGQQAAVFTVQPSRQ
jgi:hypothetical protein